MLSRCASRATGTFSRVVGRLDLRFLDCETESAFKASLEPQLLRTIAIGFAIGFVVTVFKSPESPREPPPIVYAQQIFALLIHGVMGILVTLRYFRGWLQTWDWERVAVVSIAVLLVTLPFAYEWYAARLQGQHLEGQYFGCTDSKTLLVIDLIMTAACLFVPLRACVLWMVPVCAIGTFMVMVLALGSPVPADIPGHLTFICGVSFFAYHGACRHERSARERWLALQQVRESQEKTSQASAFATAMGEVAKALCDAVVQLQDNMRVLVPDRMLDSLCGLPMRDRPFTDIVHSDDQERFATLLQQASASGIPSATPMTLMRSPNVPVEVQLLVVDVNCNELRYLVGVRVEDPVGGPSMGVPFASLAPVAGQPAQNTGVRGPRSITSSSSLCTDWHAMAKKNEAIVEASYVPSREAALRIITCNKRFQSLCGDEHPCGQDLLVTFSPDGMDIVLGNLQRLINGAVYQPKSSSRTASCGRVVLRPASFEGARVRASGTECCARCSLTLIDIEYPDPGATYSQLIARLHVTFTDIVTDPQTLGTPRTLMADTVGRPLPLQQL